LWGNGVRLLVTRPEGEGERTAARLRARGHEVWLAPLLRIEPATDLAFGPGPWAGVAFTSANGVRAVSSHPRLPELTSLPAFTVGARTREAAVAAGFARALSAEGDVEDLVRLVNANADDLRPILYFAGAERAGDLAAALAPTGRPVETVIAYRARLVSDFDAEIREAVAAGRIEAVLHYSARSAAAFLAAAQTADLVGFARDTKHFCLSAQIATPLVEAGARAVSIAAAPNESALIDLIERP
jgi:uroporphyrinogen-III synthase